MKNHYSLSRLLTLLFAGLAISANMMNAYALSNDSTNASSLMFPTSTSPQIKKRYLSAEVSATPSTVNNRAGATAGFGRSGNFRCPNITSNGATTANVMTDMKEVYGVAATPGVSASNRQAFVIGNFRYDPYCNSASSFTGQCTGFKYARTYVRLDEIRITCGTTNKLLYYNFDMNNPSNSTINDPHIGGSLGI